MNMKIKLSDAILLGCIGTVKIKDHLYDNENGCCVIGAACAGLLGGLPLVRCVVGGPHEQLKKSFPIFLSGFRFPHHRSLWDELVYRNNKTNAKRETIAAFVAKLESQLEAESIDTALDMAREQGNEFVETTK